MANFNFNKVILGGRLTGDPELKTTPSGVSVAEVKIAVNRKTKDGEDQADFFRVVAWKERAEFVTRYFRKGSSICVVGSIQNRSWTDSEGQKRYGVDIIASELFFVDSKAEANAPHAGNGQSGEGGNSSMPLPMAFANGTRDDLETFEDGEELPF